MDVIYPNAGLTYILQRIAGGLADASFGLTWHLYGNDYTPARSSAIGDFMLMDTEIGVNTYAAADLPVQGVSSNIGVILRPEAVFTNTSSGDVDIYGWVCTDIADGKVICAARLDGAPFTVGASTSITIVPELSARSLLP